MKNNKTTGKLSFVNLLTLTFIILKLTKVIKWSWLWVLSPTWIALSIGVLLIILGLIVGKITDRKK